jgi:hypothetical protein
LRTTKKIGGTCERCKRGAGAIVLERSLCKQWQSNGTQEPGYLDVAQIEVVHDVGHEDVLQKSHVLVVVAAEEGMCPVPPISHFS